MINFIATINAISISRLSLNTESEGGEATVILSPQNPDWKGQMKGRVLNASGQWE